MILKKKILIFTATYNEKENIRKLIKKIFHICPESHIMIIDDNSPDKTSSEIKILKKKFKNIFLLERPSKLGLDTAHKRGFDFALKNKYDYFITMDADMSHDPAEIKNFINKLKVHPFIIGSRYMKGGKCLMKKKRLILSKYGNLFIKKILRIKCNEFTTSYRGFNLKKLNNFNLNIVKSKGYSFMMETIFQLHKKNIPIVEIPIKFTDREKGVSKIPRIEMIRTLINLLRIKFFN